MAVNQSEKQVSFPLLSSEHVSLDAIRSPDGLCLLVHIRLCYRVNVHFLALTLISHVVFSR